MKAKDLQRKFICTQSSSGSRGASCWWGTVDDRGWVDGETPIEDYGMFMILDEEISPNAAQRLFIALLGYAEGVEPEVKDEITRDDELFRSIHLPHLLTPQEFTIYQELIAA